MTDRRLLDTHTWRWWVNGDSRLDVGARFALDVLAADARPYLSAISLWEVVMLVDRQRVAFTSPLAHWLRQASAPSVVETLAITSDIAAETAALPTTFIATPPTASSSPPRGRWAFDC